MERERERRNEMVREREMERRKSEIKWERERERKRESKRVKERERGRDVKTQKEGQERAEFPELGRYQAVASCSHQHLPPVQAQPPLLR